MREQRRMLAAGAALVLCAACATQAYQSARSATQVSECIRARWEHASLTRVPVLVERLENGYFVTPTLARPVFPLIFNLKHPTHAVWAEVLEASCGSDTEYYRTFQLNLVLLDRAVRECQGADPSPR